MIIFLTYDNTPDDGSVLTLFVPHAELGFDPRLREKQVVNALLTNTRQQVLVTRIL